MRYLPLLLLLLLLAVSANAQKPSSSPRIAAPNQTYSVAIETVGPITSTRISGDVGTHSVSLAPTEPNRFLQRLTTAESADKPCFFGLRFEHWSADDAFSRDTEYVWEGIGSCGRRDTGTVRSQETVAARPGPEIEGYKSYAAVHGIQVCTNDRNQRNYKVKGIKLLVTRINEDGRGAVVRDPSFADSFERTNCREWEEVQRCPTGQVAVGLNVYSRRYHATGLALRCQAISVTPITT